PEQRARRLGRKAERDEVVRRGVEVAPGIRQSHLVRDRARRPGGVPLHEPQPDEARRETAERGEVDEEAAAPRRAVPALLAAPRGGRSAAWGGPARLTGLY